MSETMEQMVEGYRVAVERLVVAEHTNTFRGLQSPPPPPDVIVTYGPRFARVVISRESGRRKTAHSFVDLTTGDILKADGWKSPAKHRWGSVKDLKAGGFTSYGTWGFAR